MRTNTTYSLGYYHAPLTGRREIKNSLTLLPGSSFTLLNREEASRHATGIFSTREKHVAYLANHHTQKLPEESIQKPIKGAKIRLLRHLEETRENKATQYKNAIASAVLPALRRLSFSPDRWLGGRVRRGSDTQERRWHLRESSLVM